VLSQHVLCFQVSRVVLVVCCKLILKSSQSHFKTRITQYHS